MDLVNCPNCGTLFVKTKFRDVCDNCHKLEEEQFEKVYKFIRKSSNRSATIMQVVEATGVEEDLVIKFIKSGRIRASSNPNLGYPCEKCGKPIQSGRICDDCAENIRKNLSAFEKDEHRRHELLEKEKRATYHTKE